MSATPFHRPHVTVGAQPSVGHIVRHATYAASLAGVYLSTGFLFYYAAKEKLTGSGAGVMPAGLKKEFAGSFFASVPGDNASWILLGALEAIVVILLAISLLRGEFLTIRTKPFLLAGLGTSMLATAVMAIANNMVGDHATALEVSTYFAISAVAIFFVKQLPPYRSLDWVTGDKADEK